MKFQNLIKKLETHLSKGEHSKRAQCDRIDELLGKLERKRKKLEKDVEAEKNPTQKKRLKTDLKIVTLQLKKGVKRREELRKKCK